MKRILAIVFLLSLLTGVFGQELKYHFKIATDAPDGSTWINTFKDIDKELRKQTNGNVGLTIYPAGLMGDQSSVFKKVKIGQLTGAALSSGGMQLVYKDFGVLGFPMIFRDYNEYDYVIDKLGPFFESEIEKNDFVLMAWSEVGFIYVFSKKKVTSPETLRTSKPFVLEGDYVSGILFNELKVKPIPLQMADILTSLQTGQIDTIFSSTYGLIVTQWFTKVNYMADFPITFMIGSVVVDKKLFYSMPKEYQNIMKNLFKTGFEKVTLKVRKDNDDARKSLEKYGIKFLPVDTNSKEQFVTICENVQNMLTEKDYSRTVMNKVKDTVTEYRKIKK